MDLFNCAMHLFYILINVSVNLSCAVYAFADCFEAQIYYKLFLYYYERKSLPQTKTMGLRRTYIL